MRNMVERKVGMVGAGAKTGGIEGAVVSLARLGLAGDTRSVRQLARRLMKQAEDWSGRPGEFREAMSLVLVESGPVLRAATVMPANPDSSLPLVFAEHGNTAAAPVLNDREQRAISQIIEERNASERLIERGIEPPRSLLLSGAPGVGKTMTAAYVASELGMPFHIVDLAAVMSSYLGKTGQNLRAALDFARETPCVLMLDEFDALAKSRDDVSDVGELKRIVNVLLQELEHWPAHSFLIAATNHPELLDRAIERRFDVTLEISSPDLEMRRRILSNRIAEIGDSVDADLIWLYAAAHESFTGSNLVRSIDRSLRQAIVRDEDVSGILVDDIAKVLAPDAGSDERLTTLCVFATKQLGLSKRAVARALNVSHSTVTRHTNLV